MDYTVIWKTLPGYSNYRFSSAGNIHDVTCGKQLEPLRKKTRKGVWVWIKHDEHGFQERLVSRLIYQAFYGYTEMPVKHYNNHLWDNRIENLYTDGYGND
jgi:hypothetical protein